MKVEKEKKMKGVLFLISVLLLSVAIDAKSFASNFMKIKESIKSLSPGKGAGGNAGWRALRRCRKFGRRGRYSVPVAYYKSESNTAVKGTYLNLDEKVGALGNDPALTKTYYSFDCRKPEFSSTGLCQQIAQEKDGKECTKCFGTVIMQRIHADLQLRVDLLIPQYVINQAQNERVQNENAYNVFIQKI